MNLMFKSKRNTGDTASGWSAPAACSSKLISESLQKAAAEGILYSIKAIHVMH